MKNTTLLAALGLGLVGAVGLSMGLARDAASAPSKPSPSASSAPSARASASAAPSAAPVADNTRPPEPIGSVPADASDPPTAAEWEGGKRILPTRGQFDLDCEGRLIREWVVIRCDGAPGAGLIAGDPKYVRFVSALEDQGTASTTTVAIQLRPETRVIVGMLRAEGSLYSSKSTAEGSVIQAVGGPAPRLFVQPPGRPSSNL